MLRLKLLNFSANEISFQNNAQKNAVFSVTSRCSYNLAFTEGGRLCRGTMKLEVVGKDDPEKFFIRTVTVGNFICEDEDAPRDEVHKETYKLLFPHAKAMLTAITVTANIPPIFFPDINIDGQSVYMYENPKK